MNVPTGSATPSSESGRTGECSAYRNRVIGMPGTSTGRGDPVFQYHLEHYGHPSKFGLKDLCNAWKAERWDPEKLIQLYKRAGAKYFVAMANHHDNFDNWDSKYQPWNTVNVGPKKDLIGIWAKTCARRACASV